MLGGAVYRLLEDNNKDVSNIFHDSPYRSPYVLSEIHSVSRSDEGWWFRLGTGNETVARIVKEALSPGKKLNVGRTHFLIKSTTIEEPTVCPGEYVTLSPILLRDKATGLSIVHDAPEYLRILENAIAFQVEKYLKERSTIEVVHFESQAVRKRKIKGRTVLAQKGRMLLNGEVEQLRLLVNHGIGSSPALGFGMILFTDGKKCI